MKCTPRHGFFTEANTHHSLASVTIIESEFYGRHLHCNVLDIVGLNLLETMYCLNEFNPLKNIL